MPTPAKQKRKIRSAHSSAERIQIKFPAQGRTKQSFKDECDINKIIAKYQVTGAITHFGKHESKYGYAPAVDFRQAMEIVRQGNEVFEELPSSLRSKFDNNPEKFLDFVQNPDNRPEMVTLGLCDEIEAEVSQADQKSASDPLEPPAETATQEPSP